MKLEEMFVINPNSFPGKLWQLVNDPEIGSICWDASGTVIIIHQQRFVSEVLLYQTKRTNEYFKTKDFTSIVRQLNLYGFRKLRLVSDASEHQPDCFSVRHQPHHFHNPNFERDKPELLVNLKRLTLANKAKLALGKQHHGFSQGVSHVMLKSPQKMSSTVMIKGSLYQHNSNGPEQVMECEKTSRSFQAFVHGDASPRILFTNNFDSPCAHSCSSVHVPHGAMPHHLQHRIYTQGLLNQIPPIPLIRLQVGKLPCPNTCTRTLMPFICMLPLKGASAERVPILWLLLRSEKFQELKTPENTTEKKTYFIWRIKIENIDKDLLTIF
ncbi:Heat shock factor protein 5 [Bagarius yarrelli]|uniref:Heat shock factor protein 5 n=1 Tax=Bagarius yarrelli TaxID=175774 RepID=A0A556U5F8_BAGYA|nr:Heat shock factor protein 5 [Bagarius yarrelli]